jgi:hypothetical protein
MSQYLSCAETAKLLRQALKESFPGVKFSVRSDTYSGGASIDIRWTDGPNAKQVEAVSGQFEGAYFDGMIDYKGSRYGLLDGKQVHFGADFIFENREYSEALFNRAIAFLKAKYPGNAAIGEFDASFADYKGGMLRNRLCFGKNGRELDGVIRGVMAKMSDRAAPCESATLKRIGFAGDDGYGQGTVGMNGSGGNKAGKGQAEALERQAALRQLAAASVIEGAARDANVIPFPGGAQ